MIRPRLWTGWSRKRRIMFSKVSGGLIDHPKCFIHEKKTTMRIRNSLNKRKSLPINSLHCLSANQQQTNFAFDDGTGIDSITSSSVMGQSVYLCFLLFECSLYLFGNLYY